MRKQFFLFVSFLFSISITFAQRANNWVFGNGAGLTFSSTPATPLTGGQTPGPDNSSAISGLNGNLLFYTNGVTVWNKNNAVMPNGTGLTGNATGGQCAVILPYPCQANKYIIFHVTEYSAPGYLSYSVVDMTLNNGLGDVVSNQKNIQIGTGYTEKLCAYYNAASGFYWLFTHKWNSAQFVGFKIDANSIATTSVVSTIGTSLTCGTYSGTHDAMGQLTISPDGTKIVNALTCTDQFELFDLNINTGIISNSVVLPGAGSAFGAAFSPNSKKLYVDGLFGSKIFQYDISSNNQSLITSSQYTVCNTGTSGYNFGYMEMGPDSLVYIAKPGSGSLSMIYNPNAFGAACNFSIAGQSLGSATSAHGLSRIAYNTSSLTANGNPTVGVINTSPTGMLCSGQTTTLNANGATTYSWSNGFIGQSQAVTPTITTTYTVTGSTGGCSGMAAITVSVADCTNLRTYDESESKISLFPNPATAEITLLNNYLDPVHFDIFNSLGQLLRSGSYNSAERIDVSVLAPGVYFLRIKESAATLKFIKN